MRPQTVEAAKTALEAGSRVIIAVNKADKIPAANREASVTRVLTQLLDVGLVAEQFGGDVQAVLVAGKTGEGLPALIESIILQAEIMDLKAANEGLAEGGEILLALPNCYLRLVRLILSCDLSGAGHAHREGARCGGGSFDQVGENADWRLCGHGFHFWKGIQAHPLMQCMYMDRWIETDLLDGHSFIHILIYPLSPSQVKAMEDYLGNAVTVALPSQSVRLLGLRSGSSILGSGTAGWSDHVYPLIIKMCMHINIISHMSCTQRKKNVLACCFAFLLFA